MTSIERMAEILLEEAEMNRCPLRGIMMEKGFQTKDDVILYLLSEVARLQKEKSNKLFI